MPPLIHVPRRGVPVPFDRGRRLPVSSFSPDSITGLVLWLDPSDASTLYDANTGGSTPSDGGAVGRIEDKSSSANHARQATAGDRPLYRATGLNSLGCLDFISSDFFNLDSALSPSSYTVFAVVTRAATGRISLPVGSSGGFYPALWFTDNKLYQAPRTFSFFNSSAANTSTGDHVITVDDDGSGNGEIWLDGTSVATGSVSTGAVSWGYVGRRGSNYHQDELGEVLVYNSRLSVSDRGQVHDYLEAKWGVTIA